MSKKSCDLILSGGSSKGPIHVGAMKAYFKKFTPKRIAGNSAGSLWGAMIACGYTVEEAEELTLQVNFAVQTDVSLDPITIGKAALRGYFSNGSKLRTYFNKIYKGMTLGETKIPLWCAVTNISKNRLEFFSSESHPDMLVADAVRTSTCIPIAFKPVLYNGDVYVDGGVLNDFPVDVFETGINNKCLGAPPGSKTQTISCLIEGNPSYDDAKQKMNILQWADVLMDTWIGAGINRAIRNAPENIVIARASGLDLGIVDFDLSIDQKKALISEGFTAATKAMKKAGLLTLQIGKLGK